MSPLVTLTRLWPLFRSAELAMQNLQELGVRLSDAQAEVGADPRARPSATRVELQAASYRYDDARAFELGPLSLHVARGEVLFVVGGNGSGKTTLARVLTGLYEPIGGELVWDGARVDASNRDLYRQLWSAVFFDLHVFDRLYGVDPIAIEQRAAHSGRGSGQGGDSSSGTGGGGPIGGEGVVCGTTRCTMPEGSTAEACCMDAFSSTCGMRGGFGGGTACVEIVEVDVRCPSAMVGSIMLASCCTPDNQCGITSAFNGGNCTELSVAEQMAMDQLSDNEGDGGIDIPFDAGDFSLNFPDPQMCE